jgi:anti-sigma factor RsiW
MTELHRHDDTWNDRLQDLLDGEISASDRATTESHLASCARCRAQYAQLKRVDADLITKLELPTLDSAFDRQLFARIESLDANARDRARRRLERELHENLEHLSRGWRRTLTFLLGGTVAGIALAFAFITWINAVGLTNRLIEAAAAGTAVANSGTLHLAVTLAIVAAIGIGVSKWLASLAE